MIPRLRSRTPGTRAARSDPREHRLESLAAEFALLAQQRARTVHRFELLDQQREAAGESLARVQARLTWLARRIHALDPGLREPEPQCVVVPPPPPPPQPLVRPPDGKARVKPATGRPWMIVRPRPAAAIVAGKWRG